MEKYLCIEVVVSQNGARLGHVNNLVLKVKSPQRCELVVIVAGCDYNKRKQPQFFVSWRHRGQTWESLFIDVIINHSNDGPKTMWSGWT